MNSEKIQDKLKELFKSYPQIIAVYLYGSQIGDYAFSKSDLDVAAVADDLAAVDYGELYLKINQILKDKEIDLRIVTKETSITFIFQVISSGQCIYQRSQQQRVQFEARILNEYYDGEHMRNIYDSYLKSYFRP